MDMTIKYITTHVENNKTVLFTTVAYNTVSGKRICECKISINYNTGALTITSWFTAEDECNKGYGKKTLKIALQRALDWYGEPDIIEYVWNGLNSYVLHWLERNFGAISRCPVATQKYRSDDDWESHIYTLNKKKFLQYFGFASSLYGKVNGDCQRSIDFLFEMDK